MFKIKRFVNNIPYEKNELYKNEISDDTVYKVIDKVKSRVRNQENGVNKLAK